ncbi:MAG: molybdopterin molybdenumtransferase MoeA, partial [Oxalobacter sp.]|nr:molybdopterin molybdenumtransferase MoeA [Oxalobacter sp.]
MLSVEQAYAILLSDATPIKDTEQVSLDEAVGRVLAEDVVSSVQVPSADNSAMDGYAFR